MSIAAYTTQHCSLWCEYTKQQCMSRYELCTHCCVYLQLFLRANLAVSAGLCSIYGVKLNAVMTKSPVQDQYILHKSGGHHIIAQFQLGTHGQCICAKGHFGVGSQCASMDCVDPAIAEAILVAAEDYPKKLAKWSKD